MTKLLLCLTLAASLHAATASFTFEDQTTLSGVTSVIDTQGGVTLTVTRQNSDIFNISDINSFLGPSQASWAHRTLDPFSADNTNAWIFSFSVAVSSFSIELGDFGGDSDSWSLSAFSAINGGGSMVGSSSGSWGAGNLATDPAMLASVSAAGTRSIVAIGGSVGSFPMSLYWDNITVTTAASTVPEPGSIFLSMAGLALLGCAMIGRARKSALAKIL